MSVASAYSASRSGLTATAHWADVVATNIASASQDGFVRRDLNRTSAVTGEVVVVGVGREVDHTLDRLYRTEISRAAKQETIADRMEVYTAALGGTDNPNGMPARLAELQTSFDMLANTPGDVALQRNALEAARAMTVSLNQANRALGNTRDGARTQLTDQVAELNKGLADLQKFNDDLVSEVEGTTRRAVIEDQIGRQLDRMSELMDVTVTRDGHGRVSIYTTGGTPLLDGSLRREVFVNPVADKLMAGNVDITPGSATARGSDQGAIAANFELMAETLPLVQLQLDELARSLIQGFTNADGSLGPGQQGLFVNSGSSSAEGLAGRIGINASAEPERGGALWRMRDGLGALAPGAESDPEQVFKFLSVLDTPQGFDPVAGQGAITPLRSYVSGMVADQQNLRVRAEDAGIGLAASAQSIEISRQSIQGVNIDDELQQLAMIEQAYNANSQVLRTLTQMIDTLLAAV